MNVTSLFYLVPGVTAVLDWVILGDAMSKLSILGLTAIVAGLALVLRPQSLELALLPEYRSQARDGSSEPASRTSARAS